MPTRCEDPIPFVYTIGLTVNALPELMVLGYLPPEMTQRILNDLVAMVRAQGLLTGEVSMGGKFPVRFRFASPAVKTDWTIGVGRYFGHEDYQVQQVLFPDKAGRFSGEPGCEQPYAVPLI